MRLFFLLIGMLVSVSVYGADIDASKVLLRGVDKVTGRTSTLETHIGEPAFFGNLKITAQKCLKKPPEETPENAAFLIIEEKNKDEAYEVVFNGWMFSSNPALSAMEHPIYDIWVLECLSDTPIQKEWEQIVPVAVPVVQKQKIEIDSLEEIQPDLSEPIED